jgi:Na+-transporting NADH:ubiquinone oxidoreductase subunit D
LDSSAYFTSEHPLFRRVLGVVPALLLTLRLDMALVGSLVYLIYNLFSALALHWNQKKGTTRLVVLTLVTASVVVLAELILWFVDPELWEVMSIPLRLMIPSSLIYLSAWESSKNISLWKSVQILFLESLSLALAVVLLAVFRESLGFGRLTLFTFVLEIPLLQDYPIKLLQFPGAMLILVGILMAAFHLLYAGRKKTVINPKLAGRREALEANVAKNTPVVDQEDRDDEEHGAYPEAEGTKPLETPVNPTKENPGPIGRTQTNKPHDLEEKSGRGGDRDAQEEKPFPQKSPPLNQSQSPDNVKAGGKNAPSPSSSGVAGSPLESEPSGSGEHQGAVLAPEEKGGQSDRQADQQPSDKATPANAPLTQPVTPPKGAFQQPYGHILQILQEQSSHPEFRVLVLGSGKGKEAYRIAMELMMVDEAQQKPFFIRAVEEHMGFVQMAQGAVYPESDWADIPESWKARFLLRNKDPQKTLVKLVAPLTQKLEFLGQPIVLGDNFQGEPFSLIWLRQPLDILGPGERGAMYQLIRGSLLPGHYLLSDFDLDTEEKKHWQALSENLWKKKD